MPKLFIGTTVALVAAAVLLGLMVPFIKRLIPNEDKLTGE
jgi:ABC-type cobalamin transport system permease subunit